MAPVTLTYFNVRGRGEIVRLTLAYGGIEYEDRRLEYMGDEWKAMKKGTTTEHIINSIYTHLVRSIFTKRKNAYHV